MRTLYTEQQIAERVDEMARQMAEDLPKDFLLAPVLTGAFIFAADLLRALYKYGSDPYVDFVQLSSYAGARSSSGVVTLLKDFSVDVEGKTVLLLDDVLDTGRSLHFGKGMVEDRGAAEVKTCVFVKKLTGHAEDIHCDYIGFEANADDFLVGYGMDDGGRMRGVPLLGAVN
ncbi:phosphoribosyltransferase family protein [Hyphococcus flavus]|uniref:Phosphoribosyltransferase family protein n=1 Tax=Hyphococcus flavus TaxID=1866326 RepID=A0AAE9ZEA7_9PROT|nr:phosphoribosyltransferase family protein [Hyphococcus flavus]WDI33061.1 phosphoribosyltransferase family protein [Hyphococcus flavus]